MKNHIGEMRNHGVPTRFYSVGAKDDTGGMRRRCAVVSSGCLETMKAPQSNRSHLWERLRRASACRGVDLTTWNASGANVGGTAAVISASPNTPAAGTTTVTATFSGNVPANLFIRLQASKP